MYILNYITSRCYTQATKTKTTVIKLYYTFIKLSYEEI